MPRRYAKAILKNHFNIWIRQSNSGSSWKARQPVLTLGCRKEKVRIIKRYKYKGQRAATCCLSFRLQQSWMKEVDRCSLDHLPKAAHRTVSCTWISALMPGKRIVHLAGGSKYH